MPGFDKSSRRSFIQQNAAIIPALFFTPSILNSNGMSNTTSKLFKIRIEDNVLADLNQRLKNTRWPDEIKSAKWEMGSNLEYMKELTNYWISKYNWREQETKLNKWNHFKIDVDNHTIHYIHEKSTNPSAPTLLLLHGWPSSFMQMIRIIPLLTKSGYNIIAPSLPGYGFSSMPTAKGMNLNEIAKLYIKMMNSLGIKKVGIRAGDLGAGVAIEMSIIDPELVAGMHFSGSNPNIQNLPKDITEEEKAWVEKTKSKLQFEGGYAQIQSTKPQTLAYGLNDSPVGLAAWLIEKYRNWSDSDGNVEKHFSKDELITMVMIYWCTQTINSSIRLYYELLHTPSPNIGKKPTGLLMLQKDLAVAPRSWEERNYNLKSYKEHPHGGHFGEWELPEVVANDVIEFFRTYVRF